MFEKYLDDYYKSKIGVREICNAVGREPSTFRRYLKRNGLLNRSDWYSKIDTGIEELDQTLKTRYCSMVNRCKGKSTDYYGHYAGKDYMTICEWADFCNSNKDRLITLWNEYVLHGRNNKYSVSIDRFNNDHGYLLDNIQFVSHGFNSWKRSIRPIVVTHEGKTDYFMTCEEASAYYWLRKQTIGECLNGFRYCIKGYLVSYSTIEEVLTMQGINDLQGYYSMTLEDENKSWDSRKRWQNNHR